LRYGDNDLAKQLAALPSAAVLFNYLGQLDSALTNNAPLTPLQDLAGLNRNLHNARTHEFEIVSQISHGQLQVIWRYSGARYQSATVAALIGDYEQQLKTLIAHCLLSSSGAYTPSDFPLTKLTQTELDALNLPVRQVEDLYPLAPLQHGLLFHSLYAPESSAYRVQMACQLNGELNVELFKQAWQQLLNQYGVLRSRFYLDSWDKPLQQITKQVNLPFVLEDWRGLSESEQQQHWQQRLAEDEHTPFDFSLAPLMRLALIQCAEHRYYFFWSHHHILLDGWSNSLLMQAVFSHYDALVNNEIPKVPVSRPYRDYIAWLQHQDMREAKVYWRNTLSGFTSPTFLSVARTDKAENNQYEKLELIFSTEQTQSLQDFVKQQHITLNTLLQGVWALLLSRYSGKSDVLFGTTVSGRPAELTGVEFMVGLFINSLPMRVQIASDSSASVWLKTVFEQNLAMRRYEYTPLVDIHGCSDIPRGVALFDSLVVFENYPIDSALSNANSNGVQRSSLRVDHITTQDYASYPLTISAFPSQQFKLKITYDTQPFDANAIAQLLEQMQVLMMAIVAQPDRKLSELAGLSAIAATSQPAISYAELNRRANQVNFVTPRTATEQTLAQLWAELLELEQVGIHNSFFSLGGHSLIATQLMARINKTFNVDLPIKLLFDTETIEKLAEQVDLTVWATQTTEQAQHGEFEEIEL
jgi:non-ribosomal peptide synthase protein (TIGR01720 family)